MPGRDSRFDVDEVDPLSAETASPVHDRRPCRWVTCLICDLAESSAVLERGPEASEVSIR